MADPKSYFDDFIDKGFVQNVVVGLIFSIAGYISGLKFHGYYVFPLLRRIKYFFFRQKYILIWNDDSVETSQNITALLKLQCPQYRYKELTTAEHLLRYPLKTKQVHMVILIVTDVTKLSEIEKRRERIQVKLGDYVRAGGTLFGTHDLIYRRCRNEHLQELFGCEICHFQRVHVPVSVKIEQQFHDHPLLKNLPDEFSFDDGEVCWGKWVPDAKILIKTTKKFKDTDGNSDQVPTLVVRHTGNIGTLIWVNCADKADKIPRSLSEPQSQLVKIMENAITYSNEIKQYYREHN
ncbi:hypothetical protein [Mucilaginibacter sp. HD30]